MLNKEEMMNFIRGKFPFINIIVDENYTGEHGWNKHLTDPVFGTTFVDKNSLVCGPDVAFGRLFHEIFHLLLARDNLWDVNKGSDIYFNADFGEKTMYIQMVEEISIANYTPYLTRFSFGQEIEESLWYLDQSPNPIDDTRRQPYFFLDHNRTIRVPYKTLLNFHGHPLDDSPLPPETSLTDEVFIQAESYLFLRGVVDHLNVIGFSKPIIDEKSMSMIDAGGFKLDDLNRHIEIAKSVRKTRLKHHDFDKPNDLAIVVLKRFADDAANGRVKINRSDTVDL